MGSLEARLRRLEEAPSILAEIARRRAHDPRWERLSDRDRARIASTAIDAGLAEHERIVKAGDAIATTRHSLDPRIERAVLDAAERALDAIDHPTP